MNEKKKSLYEQYSQIKREHMDAIVLLQVGGFYQTYYQDAIITADVCGVNLTARPLGEGKNCISCGFPVTSVDDKAGSLVYKTYKVVVCNEVMDEKTQIKSRPVAHIHDVLVGTQIDITQQCTEYFQKYKEYTDEELRMEYKLAARTPRKKKVEQEATPTVSVSNQLDIADFLSGDDQVEVLDFSSKRFEKDVDAIMKKAKAYENEAVHARAMALQGELDNVDMLHISPYKAMRLIQYWQEKYGLNKQEKLPWEEV